MIKNSTYFDLLKFAYNETELDKTVETRDAIDGDPLVQSEFNEIVESIHQLDALKNNPSEETIKKILEKARQTDIH